MIEILILIIITICAWCFYFMEKKKTKLRDENLRTLIYLKSLDFRILLFAILGSIITLYYIIIDIISLIFD